MVEEISDDPLLERVKTVCSDGDFRYAMFLYREILKKHPENLEIRRELHKLRKSVRFKSKALTLLLKQIFILLKIRYLCKRHTAAWKILDEIEGFLDGDPSSVVGYRYLSEVAFVAKFYNVVEFAIRAIPQEKRLRSDQLKLANALFAVKNFDDAVKVANSILENYPDDEEAKDIVWRASVDKSINKNVNLMMIDGCGSFVPPKVGASEIVMSSPKKEDEKEVKDGEKRGKPRDELFK
jgi:tetratricopeptide (TPR) repeat protein